jgi:hypothetical protein
MRRLFLAVRVFFRTLFNAHVARQVDQILRGGPATAPTVPGVAPQPKRPVTPPAAARSDAINLLAMLQREARLVDFLQESLAGYADAQIGAAVRQIHHDAAQVLQRAFALQVVWEGVEGAEVDVPAGFDASRCRLTGNVTGNPPYRGKLVHHGWVATICQLPTWSGPDAAARIVAPAEVEIK